MTAMDANRPATGETGLSTGEIDSFVADWYRRLDEHVPAAEVAAMVSDGELEFRLPETTLRTAAEFETWYEGVIRIFFDEVHTVTNVEVTGDPLRPRVRVVVNWQARRWRPPAPRSEWIGFDAFQQWELVRSPATGRPVIVRYAVETLRPMAGSPPL
jgi:hypothetical protein